MHIFSATVLRGCSLKLTVQLSICHCEISWASDTATSGQPSELFMDSKS